jgi:glycosyltransferase involved in cell wall biosynthesis
MRIALIFPYSIGPMRGNIITVRRIARFLCQSGVEILNLAVDVLSVSEMGRRIEEFQPDLIHCFHALYCGSITRSLAERFNLPYVITITGSDIHDPLLRNHPETTHAITAAQAVVCFHNHDAEMLGRYFPRLGGTVAVVPQGVEPLPVNSGATFGLSDTAFVVLLPAALRPVKRVEFPLRVLPQLVHSIPEIHLIIAGGILDQDYAATIRTILCDAPFAAWLGEIPHELMGSLYSRADLVLNCSYSESMPNTLMEAMALGRPVVAANIPGNQSLVRDGETGWLYDGAVDFRNIVIQLRGDASSREKAGCNAQRFILENFSPHVEAERYLALYQGVV